MNVDLGAMVKKIAILAIRIGLDLQLVMGIIASNL